MQFKSLIVTSLLLSGLAFAVDPPKPEKPAPPDFTIEQESKLQAILIKQQQLQLQLQGIQDQYKQTLQQLQTVQADGDKTLAQFLKANGADNSDEFTTRVVEGKLIVVRKQK